MKRRAALVLVVLILLSGVPGTTLAGTQEEKAGTINPLQEPLKNSPPQKTVREKP